MPQREIPFLSRLSVVTCEAECWNTGRVRNSEATTMDPSPSKLIYASRPGILNTPAAHHGTMQTLRAVMIPSPSQSFVASGPVNGTPIDRSRPGQIAKRKSSSSDAQKLSKKSRNVPTSAVEVPYTHTSLVPGPIGTTELPVDYKLLLLSMADQYIMEARGLGSHITGSGRSGPHTEHYCKLIATGLACLETVLKEKVRWA